MDREQWPLATLWRGNGKISAPAETIRTCHAAITLRPTRQCNLARRKRAIVKSIVVCRINVLR